AVAPPAPQSRPAQKAPPRASAPPAAPSPAPIPPTPPAAARGAEQLTGDWPDQPSGTRITLEDTASIDDALEQIAETAGWNVVLNTGRTGNKLLVLRLRNVPVEEAIRFALQGTSLTAHRTGNTIVVAETGLAPLPPAQVLSGFEKPTGRRFTGTYQETPVNDALRQIAKAGGLSIVLPRGDHGTVDAEFHDVPVEDALRAVLTRSGLQGAREGEVLTITEASPFTRFRQFRGMPPDVEAEVEEAMRDAQEQLRRAGVDPDYDTQDSRDRVVNGDVVIRPGEVARDVVAIRGSVRLEPGAEARDVVAILGDVEMDAGAQAREVTSVLGDVEVGKGAIVHRNATAVGGDVGVDPDGAMVRGEVTSIGIPELSGLSGLAGTTFLFSRAHSPLWAIGQALAKFAMYFALGLILLAMFPRRVEAVGASLTQKPLKTVLLGLLATIAVPVLALALVLTIVGILLVPVLVIAVLAAGVLGFTALSFLIGRTLPIRLQRGTQVLQLALGTALVVLATSIPVLGFLAWMA
ncbi:MAG TPA: secretin and TonB N-terminal domain-containing protein, partial [Anaeromyxobacteraceae bacterium]|nr:secretin and TonB N-terminal domain-containing protein [Anaeromyxobacteraceae bacterium]